VESVRSRTTRAVINFAVLAGYNFILVFLAHRTFPLVKSTAYPACAVTRHSLPLPAAEAHAAHAAVRHTASAITHPWSLIVVRSSSTPVGDLPALPPAPFSTARIQRIPRRAAAAIGHWDLVIPAIIRDRVRE
jgi:hypothetical protein